MEGGWVWAWARHLYIYMDFILKNGKKTKKTKNEGVPIKQNWKNTKKHRKEKNERYIRFLYAEIWKP
jgi:hypothetical protein